MFFQLKNQNVVCGKESFFDDIGIDSNISFVQENNRQILEEKKTRDSKQEDRKSDN